LVVLMASGPTPIDRILPVRPGVTQLHRGPAAAAADEALQQGLTLAGSPMPLGFIAAPIVLQLLLNRDKTCPADVGRIDVWQADRPLRPGAMDEATLGMPRLMACGVTGRLPIDVVSTQFSDVRFRAS
jgi:hypothetical protein